MGVHTDELRKGLKSLIVDLDEMDDDELHFEFEQLVDMFYQAEEYDPDYNFDPCCNPDRRRESLNKIPELKSKVDKYDPLPELPLFNECQGEKEPSCQLYGVGIIYDEDYDDRILLAIDKINSFAELECEQNNYEVWLDQTWKNCWDNLCVVREHEGGIKFFMRHAVCLSGDLEVADDVWGIEQLVPINGEWVTVTDDLMIDALNEQLD